MKFSHSAIICTLLVLTDLAAAVRLGLKGKARASEPSTLRRRSNDISGTTTLNNSQNIGYSTNITLGGKVYSVQIDTGSSDLWVADQVPNSKSTGKNGSVSYASGGAAGPIKTATLEFAGYTIPDQAFFQVTPDNNNTPESGLIGLGPRFGSNIDGLMTGGNGSAGDPPLDRIFVQNRTTPNYISFLLGRSNDPAEPFPGNLTVGEIIPGYEEVSQEPKLNVTTVPASDSANQHWQVLLDEDGFIAPNGSVIPIMTQVSKTKNKKRATVILDTGFTFPQVPKYISDAIYANITGAQLANISGVGEIWTLPCTQEVNVTFKFGGKSYPVHPLDTTMDPSALVPNGNSSVCLGAFQPMAFPPSGQITYDIVFGMAFLRNVYAVVNFGDFVDESSTRAKPYVQFLSTTNDTAQAHADFVQTRLNGIDTTTQLGHSTSSSTSSHKKPISPLLRRIVIGVVVGLVGLILVVGVCCFCGKRFLARKSRGVPPGPYQALNVPAPVQDTYIVPNAAPVYQPKGYQPQGQEYQSQNYQYQSPWEQRSGY